MRMGPRQALVVIALLAGQVATVRSAEFTESFRVEACTWQNRTSANPYFLLTPGRTLVFAGEEDGAEIDLQIRVKKATRTISFVSAAGEQITLSARVVEEREWEDGELVETSRNWFALCKETSDVYYFGEDVDIYEEGEIVSHAGAWEAGVDGALPGIIMPGTFLLGARYYQEIAPDVALDRAKHVDMGLSVSVGAGQFEDCVGVKENSPLDAGARSYKVYCPGVGLVMDDVVDLIEIRD